ncbi:MAG: hypothetical protein NT029_08125 [Armatimonadetes bacterium]|nr:hypothetical protein [Armatimonadota bacterium]
MARYSEDISAQTKRVLEDHGWTLRMAERATRTSYQTIHDMSQGRCPHPGTVTSWALAIGEPVDQWLRWAGYSDLVEGVMHASPASSPPSWTPRTEAPDRFTDEDEMIDAVIGWHRGEPPPDPEERERLKRIIKATLGVD